MKSLDKMKSKEIKKGVKERIINLLIKVTKADTNQISDGYHTFGELYEHRCELWIALINEHQVDCWKSKRHSDGTTWKGWFLAGMFIEKGKQMTYHLPMKYWYRLWGAYTLRKAPKFDGHTPQDVIKRLHNL